MSDSIYWFTRPLEDNSVRVLRAIADDHPHRRLAPFEVAYLIARGCLAHNAKRDTVTLTEKGRDALAYYAPRRQP